MANSEIQKIYFNNAKYIGGHPEYKLESKRAKRLFLTNDAIGIGFKKPEEAVIRWSDVASIDVGSSEQVSKSKVGATLMFGILGALAAKSNQTQTIVTVHVKDDHEAYYRVNDVSATEIRVKMMPLLSAVAIPFHEEITRQDTPASATEGNGIADQLTQLAKLKDQGIITEDEFSAKKKQLLGL